MLVDASTLPSGVAIDADVCVIGAGPAGVTVARELMDSGLRVCLLESGGLEHPAPADLSATEVDPDSFQDPTGSRERRFGGNASMWAIPLPGGRTGVRLVPFDPIDFERRSWMPHSGWPFDRAALDPFYERAQAVCHAGPLVYGAAGFRTPEAPALELDAERVQSAVFQVGPRDVFYAQYRDELTRASSVSVYTGATVVELETDGDGGRVAAVRARVAGGEIRCRATRVVLATGAVENARLLLLSDRRHARGLGNRLDVVGRYFMDHPATLGDAFVPRDPALFDRTAFYDLRHVGGAFVIGRLQIAEAVRRREQLQAVSVNLFPRARRFDRRVWSGTIELGQALKAMDVARARALATLPVRHPLKALAMARMKAVAPEVYLTHFDRNGWSRARDKPRRFASFEVVHQVEQAPDPENRVTLGRERDGFGLRRARLRTRWCERDLDSLLRTQAILADELAGAGLGRFVPVSGGEPVLQSTTHHHMGTTRMHPDPRHGVVDENCRVHDLANLYVIGGSVFPTGSYANPTLTIVAMAVRLADHLKANG